MNATPDPQACARRSVALPTGLLELTLDEGAGEADALLGFAARANAKRGFLFLSKVLGKHWPVRPSTMLGIHDRLAATVPPVEGIEELREGVADLAVHRDVGGDDR